MIIYKNQYTKVFKFSLVIPKSLIKGLPINKDDEPVTAKTMKILIISQRCFTIHFFSNFLKISRVNFRRKKAVLADC